MNVTDELVAVLMVAGAEDPLPELGARVVPADELCRFLTTEADPRLVGDALAAALELRRMDRIPWAGYDHARAVGVLLEVRDRLGVLDD